MALTIKRTLEWFIFGSNWNPFHPIQINIRSKRDVLFIRSRCRGILVGNRYQLISRRNVHSYSSYSFERARAREH